jgi:hypothetical protein
MLSPRRHAYRTALVRFVPEYRLITAANYTERAVSNLRQRKSELIERDAPKDQVKTIEGRITQLMTRLNDRVKELHREAR